jgi:hypothetical protein
MTNDQRRTGQGSARSAPLVAESNGGSFRCPAGPRPFLQNTGTTRRVMSRRPCMNRLYVGLSKQIELPEGGFLFIGDEARKAKGARVFDPKKDSLNPLAHLDYRSASDFVDIRDSIFSFSRCENTLTKDTGLDFNAELPRSKAKIIGAANPAAGQRRYDGSYMGARED